MKLSVIIPYWNPDDNAPTDALLLRAIKPVIDMIKTHRITIITYRHHIQALP